MRFVYTTPYGVVLQYTMSVQRWREYESLEAELRILEALPPEGRIGFNEWNRRARVSPTTLNRYIDAHSGKEIIKGENGKYEITTDGRFRMGSLDRTLEGYKRFMDSRSKLTITNVEGAQARMPYVSSIQFGRPIPATKHEEIKKKLDEVSAQSVRSINEILKDVKDPRGSFHITISGAYVKESKW